MNNKVPSGVDDINKGHPEDRAQTRRQWPALVDELIKEVMRDWAFDNLPGHGRPLVLSTIPFAGDADLAH